MPLKTTPLPNTFFHETLYSNPPPTGKFSENLTNILVHAENTQAPFSSSSQLTDTAVAGALVRCFGSCGGLAQIKGGRERDAGRAGNFVTTSEPKPFGLSEVAFGLAPTTPEHCHTKLLEELEEGHSHSENDKKKIFTTASKHPWVKKIRRKQDNSKIPNAGGYTEQNSQQSRKARSSKAPVVCVCVTDLGLHHYHHHHQSHVRGKRTKNVLTNTNSRRGEVCCFCCLPASFDIFFSL